MADNLLSMVTEHWYVGFFAGGVTLAGAAAGFASQPLMCVGVGLAFLGGGEWINHPRVTVVTHTDGWGIARQTATGRPFRPVPGGLICDAVGVVVMGYGLVRLMIF